MDGQTSPGSGEATRVSHLPRGDARYSMLLVGTFRYAADSVATGKVRNLSAHGLMAELDASLSRGQPLEVELRGIGQVSGRIVWAAGARIGMSFDRTVDPTLARRPVGRGPQPQLVQVSRSTWRPPVR